MASKRSPYQVRLSALQKEMKKEKLDGYILPRTDEFQGEFLAPYAERLEWLTGFTGSAGVSIVLDYKAVVMSDGRYELQLKEQVDTKLYEIDDSTKVSMGEWLEVNAEYGTVIGYDVWLFTAEQINKIKEKVDHKDITLKPMVGCIVDRIWKNQPEKPFEPITLFPDEIAGITSKEKRKNIAKLIKEKKCGACLITAGDSISWLLNIRGGDIPFSPLCFSYAILYANGNVDWFVDKKKLTDEVLESLGKDIFVHDFEHHKKKLSDVFYKAFGKDLRVICSDQIEKVMNKIKGTIWIDEASAPIWFTQFAQDNNIKITYREDPCTLPKSIKSDSEQEAIRKAHVADGVAVTKFLKWFESKQGKVTLSELSAQQALKKFRRQSEDYLGPSFSTIAGFNANGALIHYRATAKSNDLIQGNGLLLIDSGGQYKWGTTDITRTIAIGTPTQEMKENYTRVLKGHIAVASAVFPKDATGKDIDALARKSLHEVDLDYAHGTGHGVGCYLCVHEKATHISPKEDKSFEAGMLLSNEPGYYKEGEYGIRLENLVFVSESIKRGSLCFETVTFAPFDPRLIVLDMLNERERKWLSSYLDSVQKALSPYLTKDEQHWLMDNVEKCIN